MARNFKKLIIGFVLIVIAALVLLFGFYLMEVKPKMASKPVIPSEELKVSEQKVQQRVAEIKNSQSQPVATSSSAITLTSLTKEAENVYGPEERSRKEGVLWVDRQNSSYVATLGALNGVFVGKKLAVYLGNQKVGEVRVSSAFDVISYVQPESSINLSQSDYYRVVNE